MTKPDYSQLKPLPAGVHGALTVLASEASAGVSPLPKSEEV